VIQPGSTQTHRKGIWWCWTLSHCTCTWEDVSPVPLCLLIIVVEVLWIGIVNYHELHNGSMISP